MNFDLSGALRGVRIEKQYLGPHELRNLRVNEVSLVTEPANLTDAESKANTGWVIVKSATQEAPIPERVLKSFTLKEGEDVFQARGRLENACKLSLVTETKVELNYWMSALKVYNDRVVMGWWWGDDPLDTANTGEPVYYACYYEQTAEGEYRVTRIAPVVLEMKETTAEPSTPVQKNLEPTVEPTAEVAPPTEPEPAPEPAPEAAPPVVEAATESDPAPESAPEATPAVEQVDVVKVVRELASAGVSFRVVQKSTGPEVVVESAQAAPPPAPPETDTAEELVRLRADKARLEDDLRVARATTSQPRDVPPTINPDPPMTSQERMLAAARRQTFNR